MTARAAGASRARDFAAAVARAGGPAGAAPQYSPRRFPASLTAPRRFEWRGGEWRNQPGWYPRDWAYGDFLPFVWLAPQFWIVDYWWYDLPIAPWGFVWVRYGPNALLVDAYTGEVVEVEYDVFW